MNEGEQTIIVVKVGSSTLTRQGTNGDTEIDLGVMQSITSAIARAINEGLARFVLVSSGAIELGKREIDSFSRENPVKCAAAAAIGQPKLMTWFGSLFELAGIRGVGQGLYEGRNFLESRHSLREVIVEVLASGNVFIVNENDVVTFQEILNLSKFSDNDQLAFCLAELLDARLLVFLTDRDGFEQAGNLVAELPLSRIPEAIRYCSKHNSGTGGMASKLEWGGKAAKAGIPVKILNGKNPLTCQQPLFFLDRLGPVRGTYIRPASDTR